MAEISTVFLWILSFILETTGQQKLLRVQTIEGSRGHCSTWGNHHFKTFDGTSFTFPGTCLYVFASHCHSDYADFDIKIRRAIGEDGNRVYFTATIDGIVINVSEEGITVDGNQITLPYTKKSIVVDDTCENFKITSRIGVTITWNWGDDLKLELEDLYKNKTCGLCGSYDDKPSNDLFWKEYQLSPIQFGNVQKISDPTEDCSDIPDVQNDEIVREKCQEQMNECENLLSRMGNCRETLNSYPDFLKTCKEDLCNCESKNKTICICSTLNQFSKECVLAGGHPGTWRRKDLCFMSCPRTMEFYECVSPCPNSCSNPVASEICNEHCTEGCTCPPGTVLDDIHHRKECIKQKMCPCVHSGKKYKPGESYTAACQHCICILGHWACTQLPCSGNCSLSGGSHISTFDSKEYTFHGNCQYLMSKDTEKRFAIIAKVIQCGKSDTVTCLNAVHLTIGKITVKICYCGNVYINNFITLLPKIKDGIIFYKPSSYFINVVTPFGLSVQVQVKPVFQLFITVNSTFQNHTIGLCGNFNGVQADDMKTMSGVVEESVSAFINSWKVQASCSDVTDNYNNPCAESIIKEQYAKHWCTLLINSTDVFSACHPHLDPSYYYKYCIYDVCNTEHSEDSLCMWLSMYARDCAHRGVQILGWRRQVCDPGDSCPESMEFTYNPKPCNISCSSLAEPDPLCRIPSIPSEGCSCPEGTYMMSNEKCVPPEKCPCNYKGRSVPAGNTFKVDEVLCNCVRGILQCPKLLTSRIECSPPMLYFDCSSAGPNAVGSECQKSCKTQDMQCYSKECVSGCICPNGLISNDKGNCIPPSQCPCVYGGKFYETGETISIPCNTCTCNNRTWVCTDNPCPQTCTVYGNGHYSTFDGSRFDFSGDCDYVLSQDFCSDNANEGSFRIIIENIACGVNEAVCSLGIKIILKNTTIELFEGRVKETSRDNMIDPSYMIEVVGLFIVLKTNHGLTFMWDQKTTAIVQLSRSFEQHVCGLCGNFDGKASNDFTSSWRSLEENENVFADSWKVRQGCYSGARTEPCLENPSKYPWAQKHCSIIKSDVFTSCHEKVDPVAYYDACVSDACSCTDGGGCECLCTSIAAYSAACRKSNICIAWRTPEICPLFCDYYNKDGHCEWHYKPCGVPCMVTCKNPSGKCDSETQQLEGCYPECSTHRPYFDEDTKLCVPALNCTTCDPDEKLCNNDSSECLCCYNGKTYHYLEEIITVFNSSTCVVGYCYSNGEIIYSSNICGVSPTVSLPSPTQKTTTGPSSTELLPTSTTLITSKEITTKQIQTEHVTSMPVSKTTVGTIHVSSTHSYPFTSSLVPYTSFYRILVTTKQISPTTTALRHEGLTTSTQTTLLTTTSLMPASTTTKLSPATSTLTMPTGLFTTNITHTVSPYISVSKTPKYFVTGMTKSTKVSTASEKTTTEYLTSTSEGYTTTPRPDVCDVKSTREYISDGNCRSKNKVSIHYCEGKCETYSRYSNGQKDQRCACCMDIETETKSIDLFCGTQPKIRHDYIDVKRCACVMCSP